MKGEKIRLVMVAGMFSSLSAGPAEMPVRGQTLEAEQRKLGILNVSHGPDGPDALRFSADGRWLVNSGGNSPTQIWNVQDQTLVTNLTDSALVERAVFSADGRWLATVRGDRTIRLWETSDWRRARTFRGHTDPITAVDFSPNSRFLATGARNGEVKVWALDEPTAVPKPVSFPASVFKLAGDGSGFGRVWTNEVASWMAEAWSTTPLQRIFTAPVPAGQPSGGVVLAGGRGLVLGGSDGSLRALGPIVGQEIVVTNAHKGEVYLMDASLDGSTLVTTGLIEGPTPGRLAPRLATSALGTGRSTAALRECAWCQAL